MQVATHMHTIQLCKEQLFELSEVRKLADEQVRHLKAVSHVCTRNVMITTLHHDAATMSLTCVSSSSADVQSTMADGPNSHAFAGLIRTWTAAYRTNINSRHAADHPRDHQPFVPWNVLANNAIAFQHSSDVRRARVVSGHTVFTLDAERGFSAVAVADLLRSVMSGDHDVGVGDQYERQRRAATVLVRWTACLVPFLRQLETVVSRFFNLCRLSAEEIIVFTVTNLAYSFIAPAAMYPSIKATSGEQLRMLIQDVVGKVEKALGRRVVAVVFDGCGSHFHIQRTGHDGVGITLFAMAKQAEANAQSAVQGTGNVDLPFRLDVDGWANMKRADKVERLRQDKRAELLCEMKQREQARGRVFGDEWFSQPYMDERGQLYEYLQDCIHKLVSRLLASPLVHRPNTNSCGVSGVGQKNLLTAVTGALADDITAKGKAQKELGKWICSPVLQACFAWAVETGDERKEAGRLQQLWIEAYDKQNPAFAREVFSTETADLLERWWTAVEPVWVQYDAGARDESVFTRSGVVGEQQLSVLAPLLQRDHLDTTATRRLVEATGVLAPWSMFAECSILTDRSLSLSLYLCMCLCWNCSPLHPACRFGVLGIAGQGVRLGVALLCHLCPP